MFRSFRIRTDVSLVVDFRSLIVCKVTDSLSVLFKLIMFIRRTNLYDDDGDDDNDDDNCSRHERLIVFDHIVSSIAIARQ